MGRHHLLIVLALLALSCAGAQRAPQSKEPIRLTLIGINDFHGAMLDRPVGKPLDTPRKGGAAMMSGWIDAIRAENPKGTLLLDSGDMLQGPLLVNRFEGAPVAAVYDHLGVDAAALGNHEFDYGPVGDGDPTAEDGPFGALNAFLEAATFAPLSANLAPDGGPMPRGVLPHTIVTRRGVKVGLVGLVTPTTPSMSQARNVAGIAFEPVGPAVARSLDALEAGGAEVFVLLGHLDGGCEAERRWPPPEVCVPDGELAEALEAGVGRIDAALLGHRHAWYHHLVDGVAVTQAGSRGIALSRVALFVDPAPRRGARRLTRVSPPIPACEATPKWGDNCLDPKAEGPWTPVTWQGEVVAPDLEVEELLAPWVAEVAEACAEPLASAEAPLDRGSGESAPGILVADAMRAWGDADAAIINSGSLRADLPAGPLSYCDVYALMPFDSRMVTLELTLPELERVFEFLTSGAHSMPQVSGLLLTLDPGRGLFRDLDDDGAAELWERDRLLSITAATGEPLDPNGTFRLVATDYIIGRPGDAEFVFGQIPDERTHRSDVAVRDAIVELLRATEAPLARDGGWPLPDPEAPRVWTPVYAPLLR